MIALVAILGCDSENTSNYQDITKMESELKSNDIIDTVLVRNLVLAYSSYTQKNKEDSISPYLHLKEADLRQGVLQEYSKAILIYDQIVKKYPDHQICPQAMMMKAYVYDEKLSDEDRASGAYQELIAKFPDHPLAKDAANLLEILNDTLSTEEQVEQWLARDKRTSE